MGMRTILLTGDAGPIAAGVARDLGIGEIDAELLPEDKLTRVKSLVSKGAILAMVGDGINDAPALAEASVGVAMGSGTDVARESADVILLGNDLVKFTETLEIARWTRRIIWQNFAGTIVVRYARNWSGRDRCSQSDTGGLHPRRLRDDLHPKLGALVAALGPSERKGEGCFRTGFGKSAESRVARRTDWRLRSSRPQ
jgi:Cd2+/Zn2+-exporting ATPase/Cu+-exporting ATPase